ncbi:MAG TPA: response regulator, partial [Chitinophagaceae bacterium]|nr:response regulator [Chitinophagaceae bacterium]
MKKVMIYDDDTDLLEVCSLILQSKNFEVITKDRCNSILNDLREYQPDVVLMDNWIPDTGGVNATRLIKESESFQHIPVIFFSANNDVNDLAIEAGADYALQKPFDIAELENMVANAVK